MIPIPLSPLSPLRPGSPVPRERMEQKLQVCKAIFMCVKDSWTKPYFVRLQFGHVFLSHRKMMGRFSPNSPSNETLENLT